MRRAVAIAGALLGLAACSSSGPSSSSTSAGVAPPIVSTTASPTTAGATSGSTAPQTSASATASSTTAAPDLAAVKLTLTPVAKLTEPIFVATRPGDDTTTYIAERGGQLVALRKGDAQPTTVLDISKLITSGGERGFLGFAFAPDGAHLYVDYTDRSGDTNVDEYAVGADGSVDPASRRRVLFQKQPYPNHNGGEVIFGPDGYLYIGLGDGGSEGDPQRNGQKLDTFLSKILRIDPHAQANGAPYGVPADNPFVGRAGAKPETWSWGLRNPWRFSFDAVTHDLWIGDVGQDTTEEVDRSTVAQGAGKGANYGWSAYEGTNRYNKDQTADGAVAPFFQYSHQSGGCAVTGGYVYRGTAIPHLQGAYVYSDYCSGGIRAVTVQPDGTASPAALLDKDPPTVVSFGEGPGHELYVCSFDGTVSRLDPAS